ncbi:hypothetical protein C479_12703 [Halovivax asiaticus JCM 14624]|uniref:Uncharacterized protein n=1 Tax=Halovivax asiaticus JCM 14624 TaxID=1227490 RepID=M0BBK0_9EURY|nr:hypothetical protein [Halovivax asiaticus]ELZ08200.1 hypothetical protein C479_12703 [Halovivax asiaticus JCM 14624]
MTSEELGPTNSSENDGDRRPDDEFESRAGGESPADRRDAVDQVRGAVSRIRTQPGPHRVAVVVAVVVGLGLAWFHWLGLLLGGMLVGFVARTLRRALLAGLGFGVVLLAVFAVTVAGSLGQTLAMTPPIYLTIGAALGLPTFGALVRGVV